MGSENLVAGLKAIIWDKERRERLDPSEQVTVLRAVKQLEYLENYTLELKRILLHYGVGDREIEREIREHGEKGNDCLVALAGDRSLWR